MTRGRFTRSIRLGAVATALGAAVLCTTDVGRPAAAVADACAVVTPDEASAVVGAGSTTLDGPTSVQPGSCSWSATESSCTLRSLSLVLDRSSGALARFSEAKAAASTWTGAPGLGDEAFYTADDLPPGSAVFVQHLHVRRGDTVATVTLLGRVGPDAAHDLLGRVGALVAARVDV